MDVQPNWWVLFVSPLIPILIAFIYYQPAVMGNRMAVRLGVPVDKVGPTGSIGRLLLLYLFSFLFSYILMLVSVHQAGAYQLFLTDPMFADPNSEAHTFLTDFMNRYGERHRTFGHGLIHGVEFSGFASLFILGTNALLTGQPVKSIWIHFGFIVLSGALMGGFICSTF